jgi:hypothetical protein
VTCCWYGCEDIADYVLAVIEHGKRTERWTPVCLLHLEDRIVDIFDNTPDPERAEIAVRLATVR